MKLVTISGSLRRDSYNTRLCRAVPDLVPVGVEVEHLDLRGIPMYDGDLERPAAVQELIDRIAAADAVFITTPEYNYSVSGVLKNALDWASRPAYASCFANKPVAIASVSPGVLGGARAQQHLRTILAAMLAQVYAAPELCIGGAGAKLGEDGLTDADTRERVRELLAGLAGFSARLRG
ncbi:MAG: NAD(P)H-dependent oxidoreductase [Myxococcales bacterium]|nr:NAD(P)H-dependent oxidoreductase [Myxococcales bacterium]